MNYESNKNILKLDAEEKKADYTTAVCKNCGFRVYLERIGRKIKININ